MHLTGHLAFCVCFYQFRLLWCRQYEGFRLSHLPFVFGFTPVLAVFLLLCPLIPRAIWKGVCLFFCCLFKWSILVYVVHLRKGFFLLFSFSSDVCSFLREGGCCGPLLCLVSVFSSFLLIRLVVWRIYLCLELLLFFFFFFPAGVAFEGGNWLSLLVLRLNRFWEILTDYHPFSWFQYGMSCDKFF
jgi:hypothetical protein